MQSWPTIATKVSLTHSLKVSYLTKLCPIVTDIDEKIVLKKAFDLILSFDDVISLGYRESVQMSQLEAYLEMDSTDERIFKQQ